MWEANGDGLWLSFLSPHSYRKAIEYNLSHKVEVIILPVKSKFCNLVTHDTI